MKTVKKICSAIVSVTMAVSILTAATINTFAEETEEAPVLYLEVSNTLTAQDSFAWETYDHFNYRERYYSQLNLPNHIIFNGNNIKMMGYGEVAYKDFLLVNDDSNSRKIFTFDIQRDQTDWHSMEGGGFLFNSSVTGNTLNGFCILVTQSGLKLIEIKNADLSSFRNSRYKNVENFGRLLNKYPMSSLYAEHHMKIEADSSTVSVWNGEKLLIDKYELPENDYGYGYGPITSHASHGCWQQSYFTFSNIKMETVAGYYIKLETVEDQWGLTDEYWTDTFTLTNVEYTPDEDETIANFSEYPLFKNANDMVLFYPDDTYEHIPWVNGKADYDNAERYINVLEQNVDVGMVELKPGQQIIGAYAE